MSDPTAPVQAPTEAELAEGRRVLALYPESLPPERYTCFGCSGARLKADVGDMERESWRMLDRFNPRAKTLCALAWDQYNTDGDCLAEK